MYNPRWPHTFKVVGHQLDENGLPVTDANGDPVESELPIKCIEYDYAWNPKRGLDGEFVTKEIVDVPWGYRTSTGGIKESGEVSVADYKISCPMLLTDLPTGTEIIMKDYTRSFRARVIKLTTYNWGTNLWVDNIKN
jgi:hypothetical protein